MLDYLGELDADESADWLDTAYTDADGPDALPNVDALSVEGVSSEGPNVDEPPGAYVPPAYAQGIPEGTLAIGFADMAPAVQAVDPRAALEAELRQIELRLERMADNENPLERFFEQDRLLEEQAALAEELESISQEVVEPVQGADLAEAALRKAQPEVDTTHPAPSREDTPEALSEIAKNPFTPFTVEDVAAAAAEREAGIADEPRADGVDGAVERLSIEEREAWDSQDAEDQARLEAKIERAEQIGEGQSQPIAVTADHNVWDRYADAVLAGENIGGSEAELVARAVEMNLVDAQFVNISDQTGHHVKAVEVAVDPGTGEPYGQVLTVASYEEAGQAGALYEELQHHVADNTLPGYAVADLASHAALEHGSALDWQVVGEQDLHGLGLQSTSGLTGDKPPDGRIDELIKENCGEDLARYELQTVFEFEPEPDQPALDYGLAIREGEDNRFEVGLVKEWDGGSRSGLGGEEFCVVSRVDNLPGAQSLAQDLYSLSSDVRQLTGDEVAGWQALASMAYEIGTANNSLEPGQPLFTQSGSGIPEDPFTIQPMDRLFAEYEAISQEQTQIPISEVEPDQQDIPVLSRPGSLDLAL